MRVPFRVRSKFIRIEDVSEFSKAKKVKLAGALRPPRLAEARVKAAILKLLRETKKPKDWGGESNDIFTDRLTLFGKKRRAAFALKGPAKKGPFGARYDGKERGSDSAAFQYAGRCVLRPI